MKSWTNLFVYMYKPKPKHNFMWGVMPDDWFYNGYDFHHDRNWTKIMFTGPPERVIEARQHLAGLLKDFKNSRFIMDYRLAID